MTWLQDDINFNNALILLYIPVVGFGIAHVSSHKKTVLVLYWPYLRAANNDKHCT